MNDTKAKTQEHIMRIKRSITNRSTIKIWIIAVGGIMSLVFIPSTLFVRPGVFTPIDEFIEERPTNVSTTHLS